MRTELVTYDIRFDDVDAVAAHGRGRHRDGRDLAADACVGASRDRRRATEILDAGRDADGRIVLEVDARYTFGTA